MKRQEYLKMKARNDSLKLLMSLELATYLSSYEILFESDNKHYVIDISFIYLLYIFCKNLFIIYARVHYSVQLKIFCLFYLCGRIKSKNAR